MAATNSFPDRICALSEKSMAPPPQLAIDDPLAEILLEEVTAHARLPRTMRDKMMQSTQPNISGWLAAGAIYQYIDDAAQQRRFVELVGSSPDDPGRVAAAFGRSHAEKVEPPVRTSEWYAQDRKGALWATGVLVLTLFVRGAVLLGAAAVALPIRVGWRDFSLSGLSLLVNPLNSTLMTGLSLVAVAGWFAIEAATVPRLAEAARRLPAKRARLATPLSWRTDTLTAIWIAQACVLMVAFTVRFAVFAIGNWNFDGWGGGHWFGVVVLGYVLVAIPVRPRQLGLRPARALNRNQPAGCPKPFAHNAL
jgi:hypothetical protein